MPKRKLNEHTIDILPMPAAGKQIDYFDSGRGGQPGLVLRCNYGGRKTWRALYYRHQLAKKGKKVGQKISVPTYFELGRYPTVSLEDARKKAKAFLSDSKDETSFKAVAENFIKRYVEAKGLRSQDEIKRIFARYIYPEWQDRRFRAIKRSDVNALLDEIADKNGTRMADMVLAYIRKLMGWFAAQGRDDDYVSPIVEGMNRSTAERRQRVLNEDEIRALWKVAASCGTFGALCKVALLTAQRKEKIATMKWDDLDNGLWTIATEKREKGNAGLLQLPASVLRIIKAQPRIVGNDYVFVGGKGQTYFTTFSRAKKELDAKMRKMLPQMPPWVFHDLRRTARSLMSRANVKPHIAERVLGHKIRGVEGTYDVESEYVQERAETLQKLAALVERIVDPPRPQSKTRKRAA